VVASLCNSPVARHDVNPLSYRHHAFASTDTQADSPRVGIAPGAKLSAGANVAPSCPARSRPAPVRRRQRPRTHRPGRSGFRGPQRAVPAAASSTCCRRSPGSTTAPRAVVTCRPRTSVRSCATSSPLGGGVALSGRQPRSATATPQDECSRAAAPGYTGPSLYPLRSPFLPDR
jgi:hypothetical protein